VSKAKKSDPDPVVIKKYANRRLYNTSTSAYVTLDHLCQMVKDGTDFVVNDAKSGNDITRSVLTQIIVEEEAKGQNLLPVKFLRQLIGYYGNSMQGLLPSYLEMSIDRFTRNQEKLKKQVSGAIGGTFPFKHIDDLARQNVAMFERALGAINPFSKGKQNDEDNGDEFLEDQDEDDELSSLRDQLEAMQNQLNSLTSKGKKR